MAGAGLAVAAPLPEGGDLRDAVDQQLRRLLGKLVLELRIEAERRIAVLVATEGQDRHHHDAAAPAQVQRPASMERKGHERIDLSSWRG